jgi:hypothetical protein
MPTEYFWVNPNLITFRWQIKFLRLRKLDFKRMLVLWIVILFCSCSNLVKVQPSLRVRSKPIMDEAVLVETIMNSIEIPYKKEVDTVVINTNNAVKPHRGSVLRVYWYAKKWFRKMACVLLILCF